MPVEGIQMLSPFESIFFLFYFHYIQELAYDKGRWWKEKESIKQPSKKKKGGVEENNVPVLVGGVPFDSKMIWSLLYFHCIEGIIGDSMGKTSEEDPTMWVLTKKESGSGSPKEKHKLK